MPDAQGQGVFFILMYYQAPPHLKWTPLVFLKDVVVVVESLIQA